MSTPKRVPAKWIFSKELKDTTFIEEKSEEERGKPFIVTPLGTRAKRVLISGVVTSRNSEENLTKVTISDDVGSFYISAFSNDFNIEQKAMLDSVETNDIVTIMGRINPFVTNEGVYYYNINPEIVVKSDETARSFWSIRAAHIAKRKLYAIREALKSESQDMENLLKLGYTEEEAECAIRAKGHYKDYDYQKFEEVISGISGSAQVKQEVVASKDLILGYIKNNDTDGKGCRYEDIIIAASNQGIDQSNVDEALNVLGSEGEIYEVSLKRYKVI